MKNKDTKKGGRGFRKWFVKTATFRLTALEEKVVNAYAYILHDKDTSTPHYHICVSFDNAKTRSAVKTFLGADENSTADEWRDDGALRYLTHSGFADKMPYEVESVISKNIDRQRLTLKEVKPLTPCEVYFFINGRSKRPFTDYSNDKNVLRIISLIKSANFKPACFRIRYYASQLRLLTNNIDIDNELNNFGNTKSVLKDLPLDLQAKVVACLYEDVINYQRLHRKILIDEIDAKKRELVFLAEDDRKLDK